MKVFKRVKTWLKGQDVAKSKEALAVDVQSLGKQSLIFGAIAAVVKTDFFAGMVAKYVGVDVVPALTMSHAWIAVSLLTMGLVLNIAAFLLNMKPRKKEEPKS